ncbi:hypothetical protein F5887DRAFT_998825 [Amanita rubescens]|nr:hypothetical protein F5887DRAFT_999100 [Amanita rubescens]KAF8331205.1 hypothetical protein F5887DRAFT_998825 [Amanita rubescens]
MAELTREGDLKFRLLIIGRAGTGKSSLIKAIFGPALADAIQKPADINKEITAHCNRNLILHYYEPYNMEKFGVMAKFIVERSQEGPAAERLHAIWFCASVPCMDGRLFEEGDEMIFMLNRNKVPIIVVFTKFDLFVAGMGSGSGKHHQAEKNFKDKCGQAFATLTKSIAGQILPYALVTITQPDTLYRLVEMTMRSVDFPTPSASLRLARSRSLLSDSARERNRLVKVYEDSSESSRILLAAAHGVNMPIKIVASVR